MLKPLKTITDKRMAYLISLAKIYQEEGYKTKLDGFNNLLEIYPKESTQKESTQCETL